MKTTLLCLACGGSVAGTSPLFSGEHDPKQPDAKQPVPPLEAGPLPGRDHFRISAGWMWREIGAAGFRSGSRSQRVQLPSFFSQGQHDPGIGSLNAYGERVYADGFVRPDAGTESDGTTADWGYQTSAQVQGDRLDFHATGSRQAASAATQAEAAGDWGFDGSGGAPLVQFDWHHDLNPVWSAGLQAQWSFLSFDGDHRGSNFSAVQSGSDYRTSFTDSYDLHGITPPAAPYQGGGAGNGALLDNLPSSRSQVESRTGGGRVNFFNDVRESLDVEVNTISLGPTLGTRLGPVSLQLAAGFALNIANWDATHDESLLLSRDGGPATEWKQWQAHSGGTDLLPGFYIQGAATVPLTRRVTVTGFGRYDWSQTLDGTVGPSTFSVDLGGWSLGALVGVSF